MQRSLEQGSGNGENLLEAETRAPSLPGYLPWEQDLQMVSTFLDKKVQQSLATSQTPLSAMQLAKTLATSYTWLFDAFAYGDLCPTSLDSYS